MTTTPVPTPGRRAVKKADKLNRISEAARHLFREKGYDATTMRDIAARGGVGFGTIFDYASGKRDLLFLIFIPELTEALDAAAPAVAAEPRLIDQVMLVFASQYRLYREETLLARYFLREVNFYEEGIEATRFLTHHLDFIARVARLIAGAQADGRIRSTEPPEILAEILCSLYAWVARRWIRNDQPDVEAGLAELRRLIRVQMDGFGPTEAREDVQA